MSAITLTEMCRQDYLNCSFTAGFVEGDEVDTMYLKLDRPPEEPTLILLRPDELAALLWVGNGAMWSLHIGQVMDAKE